MTGLRSAEGAAMSGTVSDRAPEPAGGRHRILVVDDEESLRRVATRSLERAGYDVVQAPDGTAALRALQAGHLPIHLVIADLFMPGIDGLELQRMAAAAGAEAPFLLTSGCCEKEVVTRAGGSGTIAFIAKPWTLTELADRVRSMLAAGTEAA